jgi:hypothetical protein
MRPTNELELHILKLLSWAEKYPTDSIERAFFKVVASFLYVEYNYQADVNLAKKNLLSSIEHDLYNLSSADFFTKCYDPHHLCRFAIETFDSIESIRKLYMAYEDYTGNYIGTNLVWLKSNRVQYFDLDKLKDLEK